MLDTRPGRPTAALSALLTLMALGAACTAQTGPATSGKARVAISAGALAPGVVEVVVTVRPGDGPDFAPFSVLLSQGADGWSAFITRVPAGPGRLFEVAANDAARVTLQRGSARADVVAGQAAVVVVNLSDSAPPDPFVNLAPVIDYISASASSVEPGQAVRLGLSAHDPDPLDTWTLAWSASCGTFDSTTATVVTWTAPVAPGRCQLTAKVSDNRGASVSMYLAVDVALDAGDVQVVVNGVPNASPVISAVLANARYRDPVEGDLAATAVDPDGDGLSYAWSSSCAAVTFGSPAASTTTFSNADGATACVVTVAIGDGKGGQVTGAVTIPPRSSFNLAPVITRTVQPSVDLSDPLRAEVVSPGEAVVLAVEAVEPEGSQLTFTWSATAGTLDGQVDVRTSPGKSVVVYRAPATVPPSATVTVTVTDPQGEAASHQFRFKPAAAVGPCAGQPDGTACDDGNACTLVDACQAGACAGASPVACPAAPACKAPGVCQPAGPGAGTCAYADAPVGTACDDGRACTGGDVCAAGACVPGPSTCPAGQVCDAGGACLCTPSCTGRVCGPDGCGGTCGPGCDPAVATCDAVAGLCVGACVPACAGKACGSDGCGGTCGACGATEQCTAAGQCLPGTTAVAPRRVLALRVTPPAGATVDAAGNTYVAGGIAVVTPTNFQTRPGGVPAINLFAQGGSDAFIARYDAAGDVTWAVTVQDDNPSAITDQAFTLAAVNQAGAVGVVGKLNGVVTFGARTVGGANPTPTVAVFDGATGARRWAFSYDLGSNGLFQALAANPSQASNRFAACGFADASATSLVPGAVFGGIQDAIVAAWDDAGTKLWARQIGGAAGSTAIENCGAVAVDNSGDVVAAGQFDGATLDLGGGFVLTGPGIGTRKFMWIARFDGATGATLAAVAFNGTLGNVVPRSLAVELGGNVVVGGSFTGNVTIGGLLTSTGSEDGFVALLTPAFAPVWNAVRIGGTALDLVRSVDFTGAGDVVAVGNFAASSAAFRTTNGADTTGIAGLTSLGGADAMVLKINGLTGATDGATSYGNAGTQSGDTMSANAVSVGNQLTFTATSGGTVTFGTQPFTAAGPTDAAVVFSDLR